MNLPTIHNPTVNFNTAAPEWARAHDVTKMFGIKRTTLWTLMAEGEIQSVSLRRRHQQRGTRIVNIQSVRDFIARQTLGEK